MTRWQKSTLVFGCLLVILGGFVFGATSGSNHNNSIQVKSVSAQGFYSTERPDFQPISFLQVAAGDVLTSKTFLPIVVSEYPIDSPFGIEEPTNLTSGNILNLMTGLELGWVRLTDRTQWSDLQPNEGDSIDWSKLAGFENELRALKQAGITPVVTIDASPRWATIDTPYPTKCGAIRSDRFVDFANFMRQLVERYKQPEFDVHHWELGNEPDIDPNIVAQDNGFGCWGNIGDPYYGGGHYGEMLKVVTPAIKAEDPGAQVWLGGLLLAWPNAENPQTTGHPELFLKGVLEAGAAPYFDAVPYHTYIPYLNELLDHDNRLGGVWDSLGGNVVGKATYIRNLLAEYGVTKPVYLNETGLMCGGKGAWTAEWCSPPQESYYQMQADHLVRTYIRGLAANVSGLFWYTLKGPGWNNMALTDADENPLYAYQSLQFLSKILRRAKYLHPVDYGIGQLEGYEFESGDRMIQVLWDRGDTKVWPALSEDITILIPVDEFIESKNRDGATITPVLSGQNYQITVGFDPVYVFIKR